MRKNMENEKLKLEDSGDRTSFRNGAVRDRGGDKGRPDLISPFFEERLGVHMRKGAEKYNDWNWAKGMPNAEYWASLRRHVMQAEMGMTNEDHLSAIVFNAMAIIHNQECIKRGLLPEVLNDWPIDWAKLGGMRTTTKEDAEYSYSTATTSAT